MEYMNRLASAIPECHVEPGVVKIVGILNGKGLATELSCEGHADEGTKKANAWIDLNPACFKHYMKANAKKMERFLSVGEGVWLLRIEYYGKSVFSGQGVPRPRLKTMKRSLQVEMTPTILLCTTAFEKGSSLKVKSMRALERAAERYL